MSGIRTTLAAIGALAVALAVPAGLVLATSQPAQACSSSPTRALGGGCSGDGGNSATYTVTATPSTVGAGLPVTLTMTENESDGTTFDATSGTVFTMTSGSCTANTCTSTAPGAQTISAHYSSFVRAMSGDATTTVTVLPPYDLLVSPGNATATSGDQVAYTVKTVLADGTVLADVTAQATVRLDGVLCPGAVCTATTAGTQTVWASEAGLSHMVYLTTQPGPPASLVVTPHVGYSFDNITPASFTVEAFDAAGNDLGDVTTQSSFGINPDGWCTGDSCFPATGGSHTVIAAYGRVTGAVTLDASSPFPVIADSLPSGTVGTRYSQSVLAVADSTVGTPPGTTVNMPPGLALDAHGVLGGVPTTAGTYSFLVIAFNGAGSLSKTVTMTVAPSSAPATPQVSVTSSAVREGNSGRTAVHVTVTLSRPSSTPVTVAWHTANGTALAGQDYVAAHGVVTIPAGQLSGQLTVYVIGDRKVEPDERFRIVLTNPHAASLGTARATVTITNDD